MRSDKVGLTGCLFLALSCYGQDKKPSVVLPGSEARHLAELCSRPGLPKFSATWQPTEADVRAMESHLAEVSKLKARGVGSVRGEQIQHPDQYFRQYVGIVVSKHKFIYINALCDPGPNATWREHAADACDGGGCFWGALYDTTTHEFSDLEINGLG